MAQGRITSPISRLVHLYKKKRFRIRANINFLKNSKSQNLNALMSFSQIQFQTSLKINLYKELFISPITEDLRQLVFTVIFHKIQNIIFFFKQFFWPFQTT